MIVALFVFECSGCIWGRQWAESVSQWAADGLWSAAARNRRTGAISVRWTWGHDLNTARKTRKHEKTFRTQHRTGHIFLCRIFSSASATGFRSIGDFLQIFRGYSYLKTKRCVISTHGGSKDCVDIIPRLLITKKKKKIWGKRSSSRAASVIIRYY